MTEPNRTLASGTRTVALRGVYAMAGDRIGMIRVYGYGIAWKDTRRHRLLWSERNRVFVQFRAGAWLITPLPRAARGIRRR